MTDGSGLATQITSGMIGAGFAFVLREVWNWVRRPSLQLTLDLTALHEFTVSDNGNFLGTAKYVRLRVHNNGFKPAYQCEAKIEPTDEHDNSLFDPSILHWVRKYPSIYRSPEDQFAPIMINRKDHEFLDVVQIQRGSSPPYLTNVDTVSHRPYPLQSKRNYKLKVTVFSDNGDPKSITLCFSWNGTWEGFNEYCVQPC